MYNQIRKMIGVLIQIAQMELGDEYLDNAFFNNVVKIWMAPPNGLFLNRVIFQILSDF